MLRTTYGVSVYSFSSCRHTRRLPRILRKRITFSGWSARRSAGAPGGGVVEAEEGVLAGAFFHVEHRLDGAAARQDAGDLQAEGHALAEEAREVADEYGVERDRDVVEVGAHRAVDDLVGVDVGEGEVL